MEDEKEPKIPRAAPADTPNTGLEMERLAAELEADEPDYAPDSVLSKLAYGRAVARKEETLHKILSTPQKGEQGREELSGKRAEQTRESEERQR